RREATCARPETSSARAARPGAPDSNRAPRGRDPAVARGEGGARRRLTRTRRRRRAPGTRAAFCRGGRARARGGGTWDARMPLPTCRRRSETRTAPTPCASGPGWARASSVAGTRSSLGPAALSRTIPASPHIPMRALVPNAGPSRQRPSEPGLQDVQGENLPLPRLTALAHSHQDLTQGVGPEKVWQPSAGAKDVCVGVGREPTREPSCERGREDELPTR